MAILNKELRDAKHDIEFKAPYIIRLSNGVLAGFASKTDVAKFMDLMGFEFDPSKEIKGSKIIGWKDDWTYETIGELVEYIPNKKTKWKARCTR